MIQDSVWIPTKDGKKMEGLLRKPDGTGPFPAVVFVSGLGMTMHEGNNSFDEISKLLVAQGIMTVQFTFPIFDKNGLCRELPLMKRGEITRNVLSWVSGRNDVDKNRLGILAQSYGAATVLGIHPEDVRTFLFVSGAYFPKQSIAQVYREKRVKLNYSGDTSLPRSSGENTTVGKNFWEDIEHFDDIGNAKQIHQPVFMMSRDRCGKNFCKTPSRGLRKRLLNRG
ncbi:MAG: Hydrolase, alpha/beta domain protein [Microgenomates group bacterium GW2011_GWC1_49_7]|nr:MAG: Hydrolase, alpha/beta domain protein [Microgenomates group bacterium GW2011_GWC1_49_7]